MIESIVKTLEIFAAYARENLGCSYDAPTGPWTEGIMTRLCKVGQNEGYYVCVGKLDQANRGEWLYDMTWMKYCDVQPINVGLVLECEWEIGPEPADRKFDRIEYDFQKLILARADLRCMIFWAQSERSAKTKIEQLIVQVKNFSKNGTGDNYLFCVWLQDDKGFYFQPYTKGVSL